LESWRISGVQPWGGVLEKVGAAFGQFETQPWMTTQRVRLCITSTLRERATTLGSHQRRVEIHKA